MIGTTRGVGDGAKPFTDADRFALASTALSILRLPSMLQKYNNACDMLDILAGDQCRRAGFILHEPHDALNAISGYRPNGHTQGLACEGNYAEVKGLVAEALAKRRELIVEQEAFRASDERKALIAKLKAKGFSVP